MKKATSVLLTQENLDYLKELSDLHDFKMSPLINLLVEISRSKGEFLEKAMEEEIRQKKIRLLDKQIQSLQKEKEELERIWD